MEVKCRQNALDSTTNRLTENSTHLEIYRGDPTQVETSGETNDQSHKEKQESYHISAMPPGWIREVRQRKAGKTAGKLDVYITR